MKTEKAELPCLILTRMSEIYYCTSKKCVFLTYVKSKILQSSFVMLCARAVRNLVSRSFLHSRSTNGTLRNSRNLHNSLRTVSNEARAVQKILTRSNIPTLSLARVCGLNIRTLHTSQSRFSEKDDQGKKNDEDEKARMLSALKTAMGFFIVPIFLLYLFNGFSSNRRENLNNLERTRDRSAGIYFSKSKALKPIINVKLHPIFQLWRFNGTTSTRTCC